MLQVATHVVAGEVVDGSLGEHGVVLELTLAERRSVGGDDNQLGLAGLVDGIVSDWMGGARTSDGGRQSLHAGS